MISHIKYEFFNGSGEYNDYSHDQIWCYFNTTLPQTFYRCHPATINQASTVSKFARGIKKINLSLKSRMTNHFSLKVISI